MADDDLIRRGDALYAIAGWDIPSTAIAAIPAVAPGVRVKPLEWKEYNDGNHRKGEVFSTRSPVSFAPIDAHKKHDGWWLSVDCKTYPTLEAAKAAAQADYAARIMAAIDAPDVGELVKAAEPLAAMADRYDPEDDDGDLECWSGLAVPKIKHLRSLRAALAAIQGKDAI